MEETTAFEIPTPSGALLGLANSCTARLAGDHFQGSGVVVHKEENTIYVLTVAHGVKLGIPRVELFSLLSHPTKPAMIVEEVELVSIEERADLALLKATLPSEFDIKPVPLAAASEPKFAYSSGCVGNKPPEIIEERILRADEITVKLPGGRAKRYMWETENPQETGRSGGPLLNAKGSLLGIALGKSQGNGYYAHNREISRYFIDNGFATLVTCPKLLSIHQE